MKYPFIPFIVTLISIFLLASCDKEDALTTATVPVNQTVSESRSRGNSTELQEFKEYLQEEMEDQHIPALSVLIFEEDEILYEGYFGKSNIQQNRNLRNNDLFLLASVSKVVTAAALLQLYEDGAFSLNDPINDYLPFEVNHPRYNTPITFKMLLTHTSGIIDGEGFYGDYSYGVDSPIALKDYLMDYLVPGGENYHARQNFSRSRPGRKYEYTNAGNALIGVLVAEIAEMDFSDYCQQHIFNPLGMNHTAWHLADIRQFIVQPYDYINGRNKAIGQYTFPDYPNGGLRSTARDLFKFLQAFVLNGKSQGYQLLNPSTIRMMRTPQIGNRNRDMGLHLFRMDRSENLWGHDGGEQGVATTVAFNPTTKMGAIILTNQGEADLEDLLLESYWMGFELW